MFNVTDHILINAARWQVAEFSSNPDSFPLWYGGVRKVVGQTARPIILGAQVTFGSSIFGFPTNFTCQVTEYIPGHHLVLNELGNFFSLQTILSWQDDAEARTIITLQSIGGFTQLPKLLARPLEAILAGAFLRSGIRSLARLKKLIERQECKVN